MQMRITPDDIDRARIRVEQAGISDLLKQEGITEIAINQCGRIFWEGNQGWEHREEPRTSFENLTALANELCYINNLEKLSRDNPVASVALPDGQRCQILTSPATEDNQIPFTIRIPSLSRRSIEDYRNSGRLRGFRRARRPTGELSETDKRLLELAERDDATDFFIEAIKAKMNIVLVGGTGSGKTTFMKSLADLYPPHARIFTIEDTPEVSLPYHHNHLRLFYKRGVLPPKVIIESCMRMKPDHIFLAELRGEEVVSYLEALNTGHPGSITTVHANDAPDAFHRIAELVIANSISGAFTYDRAYRTVRKTIDIVAFWKGTYLEEIYFEPAEKLKYRTYGEI
ncbi:P-type DNA transfer ATPase VirB11 [Klebsiella quasipneumoniae]|uniref:P-type DNA transfer ATPase VirB11 n=1 Tax=Klebsiella quasipneumoniae TaxID=1463165 RepID=UPI0021BBC64A|nr:P-type DNA transfer ATPase VirB11 [Klebsiella quasipneumoniae]